MTDRLENVDAPSPNASVFPMLPSPSANVSEIETTQRRTHRNKTHFSQVTSKVLESPTNSQFDISEDPAEGYFKQDPVEEVKEGNDAIAKAEKTPQREHNAYDIYFKPRVFFKYFILHLLFFFVLGPFILILAPFVGKNLLRNLSFMSLNHNFFMQTIQYLCIVSFLGLYYGTETDGLEAMDVYMICSTTLIALLAMSSKYAYQSHVVLKLMDTAILGKSDKNSDAILGAWRRQEDVTIEEEIQSAILRLEIDSSLFFFSFLAKPSGELLKKLMKDPSQMGKTLTLGEGRPEKGDTIFLEVTPRDSVTEIRNMPSNMNINIITSMNTNMNMLTHLNTNQNFPIASEKLDESDMNTLRTLSPPPKTGRRSVSEVPGKKPHLVSKTAQAIMQSFAHFLDFKKLENSNLFGYNLVFDLLKQARSARYKHLGKTLFAVSFVRATLPTLYRWYQIGENDIDIPIFTSKPYIIVIQFLMNTLFFWLNMFTISVSLLDLKTKIFCFKQIGYLISPKKICQFNDRKLYPTINIFDPLSLKTWSNLRRIICEYGRKFTLRSHFNATIVVIFYFFIILISSLQLLGIVETYDSPLMIIVFGYESILLMIIFFSIMLGGAFINNQYSVHKNLLKKNKTIISDFQRLSYLYVGKDAIEPDNCIYREGLRTLRKELGEENFEEKLINRSKTLIAMIDDIIEELVFEEQNEPFCILGVPITYSLIKGLMVAIVSLVFALSQKGLS